MVVIIFYRAVFPTGKVLFEIYLSRMGQHFNNRMQATRGLRLYRQPLLFARVCVHPLKNPCCCARFCLWRKLFSTERCSLQEKFCFNFIWKKFIIFIIKLLNFICPARDSILLTVCKQRAAYGYTSSLCFSRRFVFILWKNFAAPREMRFSSYTPHCGYRLVRGY